MRQSHIIRMDTAREISRIVGDEYAVVYMDFRKDVDFMVKCLRMQGRIMES